MSKFGARTPATFEGAQAPANYVPGRGRGSFGFTTRSDFGSSAPSSMGALQVTRADAQFGAAPVGYVAGRGRAMGALAASQGESGGGPGAAAVAAGGAEPVAGPDFSDSNYDAFAGYSAPLFASSGYDKEDQEADRIYREVDERLAKGRQKKRKAVALGVEGEQEAGQEGTKVSTGFGDLKEKLADVSAAQWDMIPDATDGSLKYKQPRERDTVYSRMPDALPGGGALGALAASAEASSSSSSGSVMTGMATARGTVLGRKLDKMGDDVSGQTVVDPKGYLTSLGSQKLNTSAEIGDIKKARALLESVTMTNPAHGPGWIALARLEEHAGRLPQARKVIRRGTEVCSDAEDVWLEALRLNKKENAKVLVADALRKLPNNVNLWLAAADLEVTDNQKKGILRRALEFVPQSVAVWRAAIELESTADARIMLARAVECIPDSTDMWIGLAKLETYENARKVLNKARSLNPTDHRIWLTAAKLEEAHNKMDLVDKIVSRAVASLVQQGVNMDRHKWLDEARVSAAEGYPSTCGAIVRATLAMGVDSEDYEPTWMHDAESCLKGSEPSVETARAIYAHAVTVSDICESPEMWMEAANLEKTHGSPQSLVALLEKAVMAVPDIEVFWLMATKELWRGGDVAGARAMLQRAFDANPGNEVLLLAGVKFEWENGQLKEARALAQQARKTAPSGRVWMKSSMLERDAGESKRALELVDEGLQLYPQEAKLHMIGAQLCNSFLKDPEAARRRLKVAVQACPQNSTLWVLAVQLEQRLHGAARARSVLDKARTVLPKDEYILREASRLERRVTADGATDRHTVADSLLSAALQTQPTSAVLWAEYVAHAPKPAQKSRSVDALKKCDSSPAVITAVAWIFLRDGKLDKARKWLSRAIALDPDAGDSWIVLYAVELEDVRLHQKPDDAAKEVLRRCVEKEPRHGEVWCSISKAVRPKGEPPLKTEDILKQGAETWLKLA